MDFFTISAQPDRTVRSPPPMPDRASLDVDTYTVGCDDVSTDINGTERVFRPGPLHTLRSHPGAWQSDPHFCELHWVKSATAGVVIPPRFNRGGRRNTRMHTYGRGYLHECRYSGSAIGLRSLYC
ncbi:uncharacterized protein LOC132706378 [Cylas formicarius]|uniref:uncharacterized protein LOC132706378 n=1 Tax=Cylas formicarius TaxID=197179 RepID=UPI00295867ED|nr:uncharacterized protein LOC132706378 [Cylas formicarius]